MSKVLRNKKGITLVTLVITIILLLILAGVSIRTLGGENGLITKTKIAKEENLKSEYKEKLSIAKTEAIAEKNGQDVTLDEYIVQIKADKIEGIKSIEKITNDKASVITKEGYIFIITVNTIEYYENENTLPEMNIKDANIEFLFYPNTWTNKKVEVTVSKKENKYTLQLSKNAEKWATTNKMTFEENGEIYARLIDELGRTSDIASRKITKIDKEQPVITEVTPSTNSVRIKATDNASGIIGYTVTTSSIEPTTFIECENVKTLDVTLENLKQGTTYYVWAKDEAGNISENKSIATENVTELKIDTNIANWSTSKTITITVANNNYSQIRYTTDGTIPTSTTGTTYTGPFTIKNNYTIIAVAFDNIGQAGSVATSKITTIDTEKPNAPAVYVTGGTLGYNNYYISNVNIQIVAGGDNQSGINRTTYILSGATTNNETIIPSNGIITISAQGTTTITAYTYDNVGQKSEQTNLTIKKDSTAPTINLAQTNITAREYTKTVSVSIFDSESGIIVQKYAPGIRDAAYFTYGGNNVGTIFNVTTESYFTTANRTNLASDIIYTVYAKNQAGLESVTTIKITNLLILYNINSTTGLFVNDKGGIDTNHNMWLTPRGVQYGPYCTLPAGTYQISYTGYSLEHGTFDILYNGNSFLYEKKGTPNYTFSLSAPTGPLEFRVSNFSDYNIGVFTIQLKQL